MKRGMKMFSHQDIIVMILDKPGAVERAIKALSGMGNIPEDNYKKIVYWAGWIGGTEGRPGKNLSGYHLTNAKLMALRYSDRLLQLAQINSGELDR
jgi:hypothetical protein